MRWYFSRDEYGVFSLTFVDPCGELKDPARRDDLKQVLTETLYEYFGEFPEEDD